MTKNIFTNMLPADELAQRIMSSGRTIYDSLDDLNDCFYDIANLEDRLEALLRGLSLDYPIRTRAKVAKSRVAEALGYPVPPRFRKTQPRFPGQNLDVSVQMSNNFQVWNEEIDPERRYVFIRVNQEGSVTAVRVLTGEAVALLDTTGTLTSKYQAKRRPDRDGSKLVSGTDTDTFLTQLQPDDGISSRVLNNMSPTDRPIPGSVLTITAIADRLSKLVGEVIEDPGQVRDRSRGIALQRAVCSTLGLGSYSDGGQFPDVLSQVLEVKLQTSPTIDLGLVAPDSQAPAQEVGNNLRHCDTRYAVVYGSHLDDEHILIKSVVVSTGADFFVEFQRFEGQIQNQKLQIPLPADLFDPK